MAGTTPRSGQCRFVDSDDREAIAALVAIIREVRPHVVVTYDPNGGYGHPDHIRAHAITTAAVAASATDDYPGERWAVPKFYWTVISATAFAVAAAAVTPGDLLAHWELRTDAGELGYPDDKITTAVDATDALAAKADALIAHATQVVVGPTRRVCALSNNLALPIVGHEYYILAAGTLGEQDGRGWEADLLAGLGIG